MRKLTLGPPSVHWLGVERPPPPALPADRVLAPLAILSFNRPGHLEQVLRSLVAQRQDLTRRRIYLYQDGAVSPITGRRFAEDADIEACRELFRRLIPWGEERFAAANLGVAKNYRRAEEELFADPANAIVYFFEDDLVLHPHYLDLLDRLALRTENLSAPVGQFAAYGGLVDPVWRQYLERYRLQRMAISWAFGLRRSSWELMQPSLAEYYTLLEDRDYRDRDTPAILEHFRSRGMALSVSSQDGVKRAILHKLGHFALRSSAAAARYIGAEGEHMRAEKFERDGFAHTQWLKRVDYDWEAPDAEDLARMLTQKRPPAAVR